MPDYLVTDPATGQRIKMTGPAPPSEALIRLALAKVQPLASHEQLPPPMKQGPEQPTNAFGQTLPLSPEQDYPGKAIQSILGFLGLGNDDARSNRFGQLLAAGMPIMGALKKVGVGEEAVAAAIKAYHGSPDMLLSKVSANPPVRQFPNPQSELGAFFTIDEAEAARYADIHRRGVGGRVYPADVKLQNPKELTWTEFSGLKDAEQARALRSQLEAAGHDGIIVRNTQGIPIEIASFKDVPLAQQALPLRPQVQAYHGSPHDFERFDLAKIGTGEGAQAYGHGLYFAENPAVAEEYRNTLSHADAAGYQTAHSNAQNVVKRFNGDAEYAADVLRENLAQAQPNDPNARRLKDTLDMITSGDYAKPLPRLGKTYHVSIKADPDQFLDWDKPLSQQQGVAEKIAKAFDKGGTLGYQRDVSGYGDFEPRSLMRWQPDERTDMGRLNQLKAAAEQADNAYKRGGYKPELSAAAEQAYNAYSKFVDQAQQTTGKWTVDPTKTGADLYKAVGDSLGGRDKGGPDAASAALRDKFGIPGIKYLDQGSRALSGGELISVEQTPQGWQSKIRMNRPNGEQYFTTSMPHPTKAAAEAWAQDKIATKGTSNYVVFDDKLIDILKKYAVAGAVGGSLASLGQPQTEEQK